MDLYKISPGEELDQMVHEKLCSDIASNPTLRKVALLSRHAGELAVYRRFVSW